MPKDYESLISVMEEKELHELEKLLTELADEGTLKFPVPHELGDSHEKDVPSDLEQRLWAVIQSDDHIRQRLKAARLRVFHSGLTFAELIEKVRIQAGLSIGQIAQAVLVPLGNLKAIEEGREDPLHLSTETMANIMEVFSLRLSVVEQSLTQVLRRRTMRAQLSPPSARTAGKISASEYERALDDVSSFLAEKDDQMSQVALPSGYVERLETTLKRRGRTDLL